MKNIDAFRAARQSAYRGGGFSLVEVVLALGLITFAVVPILGLMSSGLSTLQDSADETNRAEILRQVASRSLMGEFDTLSVASPGLRFDENGQETQNDNATRYSVLVSEEGPDFPGSGTLSTDDWLRQVKRLKVTISRRLGPGVDGPTFTHSILVSRTGN